MTRATTQLPRLLALVPYLLAHPDARVADVADVFGVSESQLRADLKLVWMCGLPGYTPGDLIDVEFHGDRVSVGNADTISRPLRLSTDEVLALVVALRALADVPGLDPGDASRRALAKLEAAAGEAAEAAARVYVAVEAEPDVVPILRGALAEGRRVHLVYYVPGRDERTERDVDPMRLLLVEGRTYLEGYCRRAEGVRLFRTDRMLAVSPLDQPAAPPPHVRNRDLSGGLFNPAPDDTLITLRLEPSARWVAEYYPCESTREESDGGLTVRLRAGDTGWLRRLVLRLGRSAEILEPAGLRAAVRTEAAAALAGYLG